MMAAPRICILSSLEERLRRHLESDPSGHERAAIVLFRRLRRHIEGFADSDRYLAVDVIPLQPEWVTNTSPSSISFELGNFRQIFRRCEEEKLVFGFAHNHPTGYPNFSETDAANEVTLLNAVMNRNGRNISIVALLLTGNTWKARVRYGFEPGRAISVRHTIVLGSQILMHGYDRNDKEVVDEGLQARQAAAFGRPFVDALRSLRVAVVGAGGTGSPTATLLARAGVGELLIIDPQPVERSNLNRARGMRVDDVSEPKASVLNTFIDSIGLPVTVASIVDVVDSTVAIDALSSCDAVIGCTDDQIGREIMNAALYVYAQPLIDVGLGGHVDSDSCCNAVLRNHFGRVSTILPEFGQCLCCQGVIREPWIRHQEALRNNPDLTEEEARERYLEGGGEEAPGVGPFTSAVADYGVATLFDLLRGFRKWPPTLRKDIFYLDFVLMELRSPEALQSSDCSYCGVRHYLLQPERYRLDRPALGQPDVAL